MRTNSVAQQLSEVNRIKSLLFACCYIYITNTLVW